MTLRLVSTNSRAVSLGVYPKKSVRRLRHAVQVQDSESFQLDRQLIVAASATTGATMRDTEASNSIAKYS